jgi:hypothetical protein
MQASQLNLFPAKGGISPYYSPRTILGLTPLDYDKHCAVPFGAYVQANTQCQKSPDGSLIARMVGKKDLWYPGFAYHPGNT